METTKAIDGVQIDATSQYHVGNIFRDAPWAPEMVMLPSGGFVMGSPENEPLRESNEGPQREVRIAHRLAIGKYLVTFEEWDACVADGGTSHKADDDNSCGRGKMPVFDVNWDHTQQYITWLNKKLGLAANDPTRYRLPSEAEWEYACRAGTTGMYSTSDGLMSDELANYRATNTFVGAPKKGQYLARTTLVGTYSPNPWGLYDMHGNLSVWVQDNYQSYEDGFRGAPLDGSALDNGSSVRIIRGASYFRNPEDLRSARRSSLGSHYRTYTVGFRLARTVP